jgi:gliding motility-associated lipoprotein GldD
MGDENYQPRRKGYFRIVLPEKKYTRYDRDCPFTFEYPVYAKVVKDTENDAQPCWLNVVYPQFRGKLYLSYKTLNGNLDQFIEDCRSFAVKHEVKASAIDEKDWINKDAKVYGLIFDIEGNAASNFQFYLTDSTKNFVRGALYFYSVPNKDSLEPVVKFIKADLYHMVETFRWKDSTFFNSPKVNQ